MKKITRFEVFPNEVFVNIEFNDDLGFHNYGRWLSPEEAEAVKADFAETKVSEKAYMSRKTSALETWAVSRMADARKCKLADIEASREIDAEFKEDELVEERKWTSITLTSGEAIGYLKEI